MPGSFPQPQSTLLPLSAVSACTLLPGPPSQLSCPHHSQGVPITAELSSRHGEQQRVGRDSPPTRRGFELPHSTCRHQSSCKQRRFLCFPSCSEQLGTEGQWPHDGRVICVLFGSALPSDTSQLQCSGTCCLQSIPECVDLVSSRNVQCSCFQPIMGCHLSQSPPRPYLSPRYQSGQWQE